MKERVLGILKEHSVDVEQLCAIFPYGSRVYQTETKYSDHDFIAVVETGKNKGIISKDINITVYTAEEFDRLALEHEISILECLSLPANEALFNTGLYVMPPINLGNLRKSISAKASNSFVKCKKKVEVEGDFRTGKKSLFHCLRIIKFGIQIAEHGKIVDFTEANDFHEDIVVNGADVWEYYKDKYQPVYNTLMTSFRKVAPKD